MFDLIGKDHAAMHEGPAKKPNLDLEELERLAAQATPGPWRVESEVVRDSMGLFWPISSIEGAEDNVTSNITTDDAAYIVAACNSLPDLIAENRALQERAQMRQELVEQYEKDIARFRQKVRDLERQRDFFLNALKENNLCPYSCCKCDVGSDVEERRPGND